jgi:hypothetical protein
MIMPDGIHHYEKNTIRVDHKQVMVLADYSHLLECNSTDAGAQSVSNIEYERRLQDKKRQIKLLNLEIIYLPLKQNLAN